MTSQDTPDPVSPIPCRGGCAGHPGGASRRTVLGRGSLAALAGAGSLALAGCTQEIKDRENAQDHYAGSALTDALDPAVTAVVHDGAVSIDLPARTVRILVTR